MNAPSARGTSPSVSTLIARPSAQAPEMCVIALAGPWAMQMRPHVTLITAMAAPETSAPASAAATHPALAASRMTTLPAAPIAAAATVGFTYQTEDPRRFAPATSARNTTALAASMTMNDIWAMSLIEAESRSSPAASTKYSESPNMARSIHVQKKLAPTIASQEDDPLNALKFMSPFLRERITELRHHSMTSPIRTNPDCA